MSRMSELFAGVDLGGTTAKCVLGDENGNILFRKAIATDSHNGPERVLSRIGQAIQELTQEAGRRAIGLGMGVPGLVDVPRGITRFLPNLTTHWIDVPAADILSKQIGCPVHLLNDVRTATLGELVFGRGKNVESMVFIAIGTGIGGGVVMDGKLRLGPLGAAGELGHQTVAPNGPPCGCGNHGCLETLASGTALAAAGIRLMLMGLAPELHRLVDGDTNHVTAELMARAAKSDEPVMDAIMQAADYLAIGIANCIVAIHPELVAIGGGVANMGDVLFDRIRSQVSKRVRMIPADSIRIEPSDLGSDAGILGAVALAAQNKQKSTVTPSEG
jgi:glucokinase